MNQFEGGIPTGYFQLEMTEPYVTEKLYGTERMNMFFIIRNIETEYKDFGAYIEPPKNLPYYRKFEKRNRF